MDLATCSTGLREFFHQILLNSVPAFENTLFGAHHASILSVYEKMFYYVKGTFDEFLVQVPPCNLKT